MAFFTRSECVHAGVDGGLLALQHPEIRQHGGAGADGGHDLAGCGVVLADLAHGGVGFQVVHTGNAARQDAGIIGAVVHLFGNGIGHHIDLAGAGHGPAAAHRGDGHLHTGTAQDVHAEQALAFLQARGKKDNGFRHGKYLLQVRL